MADKKLEGKIGSVEAEIVKNQKKEIAVLSQIYFKGLDFFETTVLRKGRYITEQEKEPQPVNGALTKNGLKYYGFA